MYCQALDENRTIEDRKKCANIVNLLVEEITNGKAK
jgi:hypothetical protein